MHSSRAPNAASNAAVVASSLAGHGLGHPQLAARSKSMSIRASAMDLLHHAIVSPIA